MPNDNNKHVSGTQTAGQPADASTGVIEKVIRSVVRKKLHVTLHDDDTRERNQDAIDLIGDVRLDLLTELCRPPNSNGGIEDLSAYAATVAVNSCYQYLRERYPNRTRLPNKI